MSFSMLVYSVALSDCVSLALSSSAFGVLHVALRVSVIPAPVRFSCDQWKTHGRGVKWLLGLCRSVTPGIVQEGGSLTTTTV